ncbi:MAG: TlpA disulfide reductase family protein [Pseudomonadota bacterium]
MDRSLLSRRSLLALTAGALVAPQAAGAQQSLIGIRKAPQWAITEWINGDAGNIDTLQGKVIVIDFFQLWCPGCNKFSGPLMNHWQKVFANDIEAGRMVMVKIHTVFEGHNYQNPSRLRDYVKEKGITMSVGIDAHEDGQRVPVTMRRYRTSGTPEMAVIDKNGLIRFQQFGGFEYKPVEDMIRALIQKTHA